MCNILLLHPSFLHIFTPHTKTKPNHSKFSEIDRLEEQVAGLVAESKGFFETDAEVEERAKARFWSDDWDSCVCGYVGSPRMLKRSNMLCCIYARTHHQ